MTGLPVSASPAPEREKLLTIIREHTHRHMPASWAADEIERLFASRLAPEPAAEATPAEIGDGYDSLRDLLDDELPPAMPGYETFAERLRLVKQRQEFAESQVVAMLARVPAPGAPLTAEPITMTLHRLDTIGRDAQFVGASQLWGRQDWRETVFELLAEIDALRSAAGHGTEGTT